MARDTDNLSVLYTNFLIRLLKSKEKDALHKPAYRVLLADRKKSGTMMTLVPVLQVRNHPRHLRAVPVLPASRLILGQMGPIKKRRKPRTTTKNKATTTREKIRIADWKKVNRSLSLVQISRKVRRV